MKTIKTVATTPRLKITAGKVLTAVAFLAAVGAPRKW
jgi:hypothetical protein